MSTTERRCQATNCRSRVDTQLWVLRADQPGNSSGGDIVLCWTCLVTPVLKAAVDAAITADRRALLAALVAGVRR